MKFSLISLSILLTAFVTAVIVFSQSYSAPSGERLSGGYILQDLSK